MGRRIEHPSWCADGYRCTARYATGEHRSESYTLTRGGGRVGATIATTRRIDRPYAEAQMHMWVRLTSTDDDGQRREIRELIRLLSAALESVERATAPGRLELPRAR